MYKANKQVSVLLFPGQELNEGIFKRIIGSKSICQQFTRTTKVKISFAHRILGSGCTPCRKQKQQLREQQYIETLEEQKQQIQQLEIKLEEEKRQKVQPPTQKPMPKYVIRDFKVCTEHQQPFSVYCQQEGKLICQTCQATSHQGHMTQELQEVAIEFMGRVGNLMTQMIKREDEAEKKVNFILKGKEEANEKLDQLTHYINKKVEAMIRDLIIKLNQYQYIIRQWKQDLQEEVEGLSTAWKQIKNKKVPQDAVQLVNIENNLMKLSQIDGQKLNEQAMNFIMNLDLSNCPQQVQLFHMEIESQLRNLKTVVTQGVYQEEIERLRDEQANILQMKIKHLDQINKELSQQRDFQNFMKPELDEVQNNLKTLNEEIYSIDRETNQKYHQQQEDLKLLKNELREEHRQQKEELQGLLMQLQNQNRTEIEKLQLLNTQLQNDLEYQIQFNTAEQKQLKEKLTQKEIEEKNIQAELSKFKKVEQKPQQQLIAAKKQEIGCQIK